MNARLIFLVAIIVAAVIIIKKRKKNKKTKKKKYKVTISQPVQIKEDPKVVEERRRRQKAEQDMLLFKTAKVLISRGYMEPENTSKFIETFNESLRSKEKKQELWDLFTETGQDPEDGFDYWSIFDRERKREFHKNELKEFKSLGYKKVKIKDSPGNRRQCAGIKKHVGVYDINKVPILPCKECTSSNCLCWYESLE